MESAVTAPVSGHVKRVTVHEGMNGFFSVLPTSTFTDAAHVFHRRLDQPRRFGRGDCALKDVFLISLGLFSNDIIQVNMQCTHRFRRILAQQLVLYCNKWVNETQLYYFCFLIHVEDVCETARLERRKHPHQKVYFPF